MMPRTGLKALWVGGSNPTLIEVDVVVVVVTIQLQEILLKYEVLILLEYPFGSLDL